MLQRLHCSFLLRFVVAAIGILYLESSLAFVGIIPRIKQRGSSLKATEVREESALRSRKKELMQGPNFLKVLYNPRKIQASPMDLAHEGVKMMVSPRGQYYPFGQLGHKVMLLSGEALDIIQTLRTYLNLYSASEEMSLRILLPLSTKTTILDGERHNEATETLSKFYIEDKMPTSEGILFMKGSIPNLLITTEWILEVVNSEEHQEDMKRHMTYIFADSRHQHNQIVEMSFPIANSEATILIGKAGTRITELCEHFKITAIVNEGQSSEQRTVVLKGSIGDVHQAHFEILRRLSLRKEQPRTPEKIDDEDE